MAQILIEPPFETAVAPVDMDALVTLYHIEDWEGVQKYLAAHPLALPLLLAAPAHIARVFGPDVSIRLVIAHDPEWMGRQDLWVDIAIPMETEADEIAADATLRRLHEEWLLHLPRIQTRDALFSVEAAK